MIFIYTTLDKDGEKVIHRIEEPYNPNEIQYCLETLNIYYQIEAHERTH